MSAVVLEASSVLRAHPQASRGRSSAGGGNRPTDPFSQLLEGTGSAPDSTTPAQTAPERTRSEHSPRDDKAGTRRTDAPAKVTKPKSANETKDADEAEKVDEAPAASDTQAPAEIASGTIELQTEIAVNIVLNGANIAAGEGEADPVLPLDDVPATAVDPATLLASAQLAPVAAPLPVTAAPSSESTSVAGDVAAVDLVTEMAPAGSTESDAPAPDALPSVAAKPVKSTSAGETADATQTPALFEESAAEPTLETAAVKGDVAAARARDAVSPHGAAQASKAPTAPHHNAEPHATSVAAQAADRPAELPAAGPDMSVARAAPEPLSNSTPPALPQSLTGSAMAPPAQPPAVASGPAAAVPVAGLAIEIAARAQPGKNHFEIRLDPPELGRIDVRLDVDREGNVTSRLVVERAETLDLLRRDAPNLERAFQQAGLKTSDNSLQFSLRDQAFSGRDSGEQTLASARIIVPEDDGISFDMQRNYGRLAGLGNGVDIRV